MDKRQAPQILVVFLLSLMGMLFNDFALALTVNNTCELRKVFKNVDETAFDQVYFPFSDRDKQIPASLQIVCLFFAFSKICYTFHFRKLKNIEQFRGTMMKKFEMLMMLTMLLRISGT